MVLKLVFVDCIDNHNIASAMCFSDIFHVVMIVVVCLEHVLRMKWLGCIGGMSHI